MPSALLARRLRAPALLAVLLLAAAPASAGRPRTDAPGDLGRFAVGHDILELVDPARGDRPLPTEVWYPAEPRAGDPLTAYELILGFAIPSAIAFEAAPAGPGRATSRS